MSFGRNVWSSTTNCHRVPPNHATCGNGRARRRGRENPRQVHLDRFHATRIGIFRSLLAYFDDKPLGGAADLLRESGYYFLIAPTEDIKIQLA